MENRNCQISRLLQQQMMHPRYNVPPGEDVVYYKILSCGKGPQEQIVPLELIVSAPVQKGDVGDGKIALQKKI